jgi:hypothetical protein
MDMYGIEFSISYWTLGIGFLLFIGVRVHSLNTTGLSYQYSNRRKKQILFR